MTNFFHPVLRRTALSSAVAQHEEIFNEQSGILGVLMPMWIDEDQILPCFAPRLILQNKQKIYGEHANKAALHLSADKQLVLARLLTDLMTDNDLHARLERHVEDVSVPSDVHNLNVMFFPNAIFMIHDDPWMYINDHLHLLQTALAHDATRSPICTMLIPTPSSNHIALKQTGLAAKDFDVFMRMAGTSFVPHLDHLGIAVCPPSDRDIVNLPPDES